MRLCGEQRPNARRTTTGFGAEGEEPKMSVLTAGAPPRTTDERDHKALIDAVASGRIAAEPDL
jgi:hypothetical protein